jgi:nickel-dependent lactate racemase
MDQNESLSSFHKRILGKDYFVMDQWQLEELAKVCRRAKVKVYSDGLDNDTLRRCFVDPIDNVDEAVLDSLAEYGPDARVAVIPKGPYVLPRVARQSA